MKALQIILYSVLSGILIFVSTPALRQLIENPNFMEFREQFIFFTGICTMIFMTTAMLISLRIPLISKYLKGLDKAYSVHKNLGLAAAVSLSFHYLAEDAPKWLYNAGLLKINENYLSENNNEFFHESGLLAALIAFFLIIILLIITQIHKIPYHWFRSTHKIFSVVYLFAAYHAVLSLIDRHWQFSLGGILLIFIIFLGIIASLVSILAKIGEKRKFSAKIVKIDIFCKNILDVYLSVENQEFKYKAGQYVFLKFSFSSEPHPFTISSFDMKRKILRFSIKDLGDFTHNLFNIAKIGDEVEVEGAYGEFLFEDDFNRQIWIAAGIGITPFMARLDYFSTNKNNKQIFLFYSSRGHKNEIFPKDLEQICSLNNVKLIHVNTLENQRITIDFIKEKSGDLENASLWFCGNENFGHSLLKWLKFSNFDMKNLHYDTFNMR
ncbi:MAG: ferric reductase-like transmembrane domain-containing protein [Flavobacteriaceae bacterium]|nr:ferric reductase-like transmembrane domain-containing protein [Flavobacteriaceae bacterium]